MPPHSLPTIAIVLTIALIVVTFIYADAAEDIINGWGFTEDDE